jgi:hypothetical protein
MKLYSKPNCAAEPPTIRQESYDLACAIRDGGPVSRPHPHIRYAAQMAAEAAGRLACEAVAAALTDRGVHATVLTFPQHQVYHVSVTVTDGDEVHQMDAEAAGRLLDRLASLPPAEAVRRTVAEADAATPVLSPAALGSLLRAADAHERRVLAADADFVRGRITREEHTARVAAE